jgi:hypothetical protein
MRAAAREAGRDPAAIELSVSPSAWKPDAWSDKAALKAYADLGVTRFVCSAGQASGDEMDVVEAYLKARLEDAGAL